ncbi:MAG: tripartite tricarboxylate transporter TctB family protein, partial [Desulfobacterales bacterium]|nr:tripartite tricarboxylate transporter TctB family protein [Desulfobacterales bacterium]
MKIKGSSLFLLFTLAIGIAFLVLSLGLHTIEDKLAPLLFSGFLIILAGIEVIKTFSKSGSDKTKIPQTKDQPAQLKIEPGRVKAIVAWMGGPILGISLVGFNVTIPLFIITFMKLHKESWLLTITITALTSAFFVFVCE